MTPETLLLRQIHPNFYQSGRVTSQAFRPTPKDDHFLSVDNGDRIVPQAAWARFTQTLPDSSLGVMGISKSECSAQALPVEEDGVPYPEHCTINFSAFEKKRN